MHSAKTPIEHLISWYNLLYILLPQLNTCWLLVVVVVQPKLVVVVAVFCLGRCLL
jgi:hypothetical protein